MESPIINSNSRRSSASNSPEFEFWTTLPHLHQSTADQLFSGGILLPFHHQDFTKNTVPTYPDEKDHQEPTNTPNPDQKHHKDATFEPKNTQPINPTDPDENINGSDLKATPLTASKRWKDIFKKNPDQKDKEKKKKTKEKFSGAGTGPGTSGTAELNINLWPFSRSRSAGNRPRSVVAVGNRKVSSAPCSRSNSTGDKNRKWPSSPGRAGVHLGRSSPVWQGAKRFGQSRSLHDNLLRNTVGPTRGGGGGVKVVPKGMSCRSGVGVAGSVAAGVTPAGDGGGGGGGGNSTSLFNLRTLFTKKVVF